MQGMEKLTEELDALVKKLKNSKEFHEELEQLVSVYPFSRYEYVISSLLSQKVLTFDQYMDIRDTYVNRNLFLYVFEISAPRGFGDTWAFSHLMSVVPDFKRPTKRIDPTYRGEYDLYLFDHNGKLIRIEVKASRAVDRERTDAPLYVKALASDSDRPFLMNFQQLKPSCCDVFFWIAVYRDCVKYWVLNSNDVRTHKDFTPQHRNENTSTRDSDYNRENIYEGQIMITDLNIGSISKYETTGPDIKNSIIRAFGRGKGPGSS
jgi:hypothetical protein